MTKFEVGKKYSCRSACDWDCIFTFTIVSRTDKSAVLMDQFGKNLGRKKIYKRDDGNSEAIMPLGRYAFSPVIFSYKGEIKD